MIDAIMIEEFTDDLRLLSQQKGSRFRGTFDEDTHTGESAAAVDQIEEAPGPLKRTQKHAPKVITDLNYDRRWVSPDDWDFTAMVDNEDKLRLALDPQSKVMATVMASLKRQSDDTMIASFFADARTGRSGGDTTVFGSGQTVAVTVGSGATDSGLNTEKLLQAREIIMGNDVDIEDPANQIYCAISSKQEHELLNQIKVSNGDYNKPIFSENAGGRVLNQWYGINFVISERLEVEGGDAVLPFWAKSGMHYGIWRDIYGDLTQSTERQRNPFYIEAHGTFGATRIEEKKVVKIVCNL